MTKQIIEADINELTEEEHKVIEAILIRACGSKKKYDNIMDNHDGIWTISLEPQ